MGRDLNKATPRIKTVILEVLKRAPVEINEFPRVTFVDRTVQEQVALYAQGRDKLANVNLLRKKANMSPITLQENKYKVTWTMASRHIVDLHDDDPINDLSRAVDLGLFDGNKYVTGKNRQEIDRYIKLANFVDKIAKELKSTNQISGDIILGAKFKTPDFPHFEEAKPYSNE